MPSTRLLLSTIFPTDGPTGGPTGGRRGATPRTPGAIAHINSPLSRGYRRRARGSPG